MRLSQNGGTAWHVTTSLSLSVVSGRTEVQYTPRNMPPMWCPWWHLGEAVLFKEIPITWIQVVEEAAALPRH